MMQGREVSLFLRTVPAKAGCLHIGRAAFDQIDPNSDLIDSVVFHAHTTPPLTPSPTKEGLPPPSLPTAAPFVARAKSHGRFGHEWRSAALTFPPPKLTILVHWRPWLMMAPLELRGRYAGGELTRRVVVQLPSSGVAARGSLDFKKRLRAVFDGAAEGGGRGGGEGVSIAQLERVLHRARVSLDVEQRLRLFDGMGLDRSGRLSFDEFAKALARAGEHIPGELVHSLGRRPRELSRGSQAVLLGSHGSLPCSGWVLYHPAINGVSSQAKVSLLAREESRRSNHATPIEEGRRAFHAAPIAPPAEWIKRMVRASAETIDVRIGSVEAVCLVLSVAAGEAVELSQLLPSSEGTPLLLRAAAEGNDPPLAAAFEHMRRITEDDGTREEWLEEICPLTHEGVVEPAGIFQAA